MFLSFLVPFRSMVRGSSHPSVDILVLVPYSNHGTRTKPRTSDRVLVLGEGFLGELDRIHDLVEGFQGEIKLVLDLFEGFLEELKLILVLVELFSLLVQQLCIQVPTHRIMHKCNNAGM
jgi:hypothetical protein